MANNNRRSTHRNVNSAVRTVFVFVEFCSYAYKIHLVLFILVVNRTISAQQSNNRQCLDTFNFRDLVWFNKGKRTTSEQEAFTHAQPLSLKQRITHFLYPVLHIYFYSLKDEAEKLPSFFPF